jgi:hypothetical protein
MGVDGCQRSIPAWGHQLDALPFYYIVAGRSAPGEAIFTLGLRSTPLDDRDNYRQPEPRHIRSGRLLYYITSFSKLTRTPRRTASHSKPRFASTWWTFMSPYIKRYSSPYGTALQANSKGQSKNFGLRVQPSKLSEIRAQIRPGHRESPRLGASAGLLHSTAWYKRHRRSLPFQRPQPSQPRWTLPPRHC